MAEDHQRARLAEWADSQGVDRASKLIFLSLPSTIREIIRFLGQVKTARNPSALLMARIRMIFPAFVVLDAEARQHWNYPRELAKPMVWILVRGESNREGWSMLESPARHSRLVRHIRAAQNRPMGVGPANPSGQPAGHP